MICNKCEQEFQEGGTVVIYSVLGIGSGIVVMPAEDFTDLTPHELRMKGRENGVVWHLCGKACWLRFCHEVFDKVVEPRMETTEVGNEG